MHTNFTSEPRLIYELVFYGAELIGDSPTYMMLLTSANRLHAEMLPLSVKWNDWFFEVTGIKSFVLAKTKCMVEGVAKDSIPKLLF